MRTRKSLLPIVVLCVTVVGLALCQEKRWSKTAAAKHRDKSTKGKYEPDYADRTREEEEEEREEAIDENSKELYHDRGAAATSDYHVLRFIDELAAFRNNRAIGNSRYVQQIPSPRNRRGYGAPFANLEATCTKIADRRAIPEVAPSRISRFSSDFK